MLTRRNFLKLTLASGLGLAFPWKVQPGRARALVQSQLPPLDATLIPKYVSPLVKPPAMPTTGEAGRYRIAVRQFQQQILPKSMGLPPTTVWSYGSADHPGTVLEGGTFNYPSFTIEATVDQPVEVEWINDLVDAQGNYLPHLLPVDQTLHWAYPNGGLAGRDGRGNDPTPYMGPVPIVTHVHGAHTTEESDGYAEAWFLPAADNIPAGYATTGTWYDKYVAKYGLAWEPGTATFRYPNNQLAGTLWYHDHTLGMTRLNVYAGPAGFYILRGGPGDAVGGTLPGPAPVIGSDPFGTYYEIPLAIQDRSFKEDGSLWYPDNRAFFEGLTPEQLQIPFIPETACGGEPSDIPPIWNPEFFGNTMLVNGATWPYLEVEQRRYRFRILNGCNSRFVILKLSNGQPFYQIGSEGGFLPEPIELQTLLMAPAERVDVILDFTNVPAGTEIILQNIGPDEPFGGGTPGVDFPEADPATTGQVMQLRVVPATSADPSTPALDLMLPAINRLGDPDNIRQVALLEADSGSVLVDEDEDGNIVLDCSDGEPFGPAEALLGTVTLGPGLGMGHPMHWDHPITENPVAGTTEVWEIHNFTMDAHPIHIHEAMFEVVNREDMAGSVRDPDPGETGWKDTVIAYPDEITRVKVPFEFVGRFVWHCHIVEHEDNEMMRPYEIVPQVKAYFPLVER